LFKKIYENEFGTPGGEPYGALIGDYEWTQHPDDVETLRLISNIAAGAFAPFISAAGPGMFGFDSYTELAKPRDLAKIFETAEYTKWRSFRDSEDARFVNLVMPRTLARVPYGAATKPIEEFNYEEAPFDAAGAAKAMEHTDYCWMNAAYAMGTRLTNAFAQYGFCTAIRGAEGGGKVENLPYHVFTSDDGDQDAKCPTEIAITDRREHELAKSGLIPIIHRKNTDKAAFIGAQSVYKPKAYQGKHGVEATASDNLSARLPYMFAVSRFAHYLKCMVRDKIGSMKEKDELRRWLQEWINEYVDGDPVNSSEATKCRKPLAAAKVEIFENEENPGYYNARFFLRPHYQLEGVDIGMSLVSRLPSGGNS
jgi:type VI secretion system protein ImpC